MKAISHGNDVLTFFAELAVYASVVACAVRISSGPGAKALAAVGGVIVMAVAWGLFAAPKASSPLHGAERVVFEFAWFGIGVVALYVAGWRSGAAAFAVICLVSGVLRMVQA
jgi:hypothetical protein